MEPLPAAFYGAIDSKNPVIATFDNEIKEFLGFMRKLQRAPPGEAQQQDHRRGSSTLFHIWVKYKPRLPAWYYQEKLLKVGDSLAQIREYKLALFQCYGRYLEQFCSLDIDEISDVEQFKSTFFPNGTDDEKAGMMFHALQGRCICMYQLVKTSDANLRNPESVKKCLNILSFLQLIMQVVLPQEHLCWLIFNGSLHIYTICRHLMALGHSSEALESLLWASVCMESSVPLLSVHYLTWRATLYTAVCQCYFDCQAGVHGEVFARRALSKISELSQLEHMSDSSYNEETKKAFKESTLKMAVMIFKRAVFESRRKPKGILRPKLKNNLKEAEKLPWPRTNTERLLVEIFGNNAAQFLAIVEALTDSNRRVLQAGPPMPDEPEIHDVIAELCFAGTDILSGGGNKGERNIGGTPESALCKLLKESSLLELAVQEKDAMSAEAVVKYSKLAFSYEHWEAFDAIIAPLYSFLQANESVKWKKEEMDLSILIVAEPLLSGKKHKHNVQSIVKQNNIAELPDYLGIIGLQGEPIDNKSTDDHIALAETLYSCVCRSSQDVQPDRDIVIDVILFLWQKCKAGVQRIQPGLDGCKFVQKCEMNSKWIYILCLIYEVMQHSGIIHTDAVILGEAALRLAGIAESMADAIMKCEKKSGRSHETVIADVCAGSTKPRTMKKTPLNQLIFAYETIDKAINGLAVSPSESTGHHNISLVDHYIRTLGAKRQHAEDTLKAQNSSSKSLVNNVTMMDLQLELIVAQHRVSIKILRQEKDDGEHLRSCKSFPKSQGRDESLRFLTESEILAKINKNKLSKAIFLMQKAMLLNKGLDCSPSMLLEDSEKLIQQAETEENVVYLTCIKQSEPKGGKMNVPPSPILLCRTENSMVFKPAPFASDSKVIWYSLFGRIVTGPNLKVRLNDHYLLGTGEQVPANGNVLLEAKGLKRNEKYIFAVAAYAEDGRIIGDVIGESTKPILASLPLSVPATLAYLAQSAYHIGHYKVSKKACSVLWNYFVFSPNLPPNPSERRGVRDEYITQMRLCPEAVSNSSPILLQLFMGSIFMFSDINIKEGALFSDSVCDGELSRKGQICRIAECERLLVALDVSTLLRDTSYALQAVVQCYGLIAPLIYHRIPSAAVVQILIKCLAVLQEIPSSTWQRKQAGVSEGVLHMTACMVYFVAKTLRSWEEYELAICIIEIGKKLLDLTENTSVTIPSSQAKSICDDETEKAKDANDKEKGHPQKKHQIKKMLITDKVNEQLNALEQTLLKLTKPSAGTQLTGQEDPILLYSVVSCWSPSAAFKEIMKFKKKSRFLEFLIHLLQRVYYEEKFQKILEWSSTALDYLKRRNEDVFGNRQTEETGDIPAPNDSFRRYTTALVEYKKDMAPSTQKQSKKQNISKKVGSVNEQKKKNRNVEPHRLTREEIEKKAFKTLFVLLTPIVGRYIKRKRVFQASREEMPWRAQMNLLLALTHFSLFKKKLSQLSGEELASEQGISRAAFKCWCQALDEMLNMSDALNSWQEPDSSPDGISNARSKDYSEKFLSRAGIWGCLLAAVIAAKMSRYILTSDVRKRTDCCFLSASLFKSLFRVSLPHPDEDLDYALYEIGEGCEVSELIPGIDLFSDRHRADVITVVSSLGFLISELHSVAQNLMVLPLFTLYQYFVSTVCRDPVRSVEGRLLKVNVLIDLHLFSEAFQEFFLLNSGQRIPRRPHEGFSTAGKVPAAIKFLASNTLISSENLEALDEILYRKPSPCLLSVCDQATMNKLVLAKTYFILKLSSTINAIPEIEKEPGYYVTGDRTKPQSKNREPTLSEDYGSEGESDAPVQLASRDLTLPKLKNMLLKEAEGSVKCILQDVEMKYNYQLSECTTLDLELAIEAKLLLSEIAQQKLHIAESIAMSFSALKILQEAKLFAAKTKRDNKNGQIREKIEETFRNPFESEARERLSINTWLRCRLAFVTVLTRQIRGIALHDQDVLDASALITEGIVEAEALNDSETQARFMLQAAFLDIQEGHPRKGVQLMLKNIIHLLQGKCFMSPVAYLTLAQSLILSTDLMENNKDQQLFWAKQLNNYKLAQELITKQLASLGETIEYNVLQPVGSSAKPSLNNIYLPQIGLLAKVQMRIGRLLILQANSSCETSVNPSYILPSLNLYNMALGICRLSAFRQRDLEAELLFLKGKTERLMFVLGDHEKSCAIKSFSDAISISRDKDQNFSLIRKCYLEIALVYLHMSSLDANKINSIPLPAIKTPTSKRKVDKVTEKDGGGKTVSPSELFRLLAWIAVRAATQVATSMLAYKQLIGEKDVNVQAIKTKLHQHIPTFASMDLLAIYKKYLHDCCSTDNQPNSAVKEELAAESPVEGKKSIEDSLPIDMLSWVHVIRYHNHLMRLKNLVTMTDFDDGKVSATDTMYTSVFDNGITLRYVEMHLFLKKYLDSYSPCCVNDFPAELLWGLEQKTTSFYTSSKTNLENKEFNQHTPQPLITPSSRSLQSKLQVQEEHMAIYALDQELCLQWYLPPLERSAQEKPMVLLMYAYNKQNIDVKDPKKCDPSAVQCGYLWVSLSDVLSLHEKLCNLRHKAEISIHDVSDTSISGSGEKPKRSSQTAANKRDLKPVKITEELQAMVVLCCSEAKALMSTDPTSRAITQAPFDITLPSLIRLERVFDLTHGCMLMKGSLLDWTVSQLT
ncbi:cilia- and flagella-associated protein 54 isoform X3 [Phyllobates terribilis]|uniref:cilia- and flagella-associated protein 54 isoform X3 n=1 Tax=Phyllobates terribilis TaxID=111132 RepID=UPI003CCAC8EF